MMEDRELETWREQWHGADARLAAIPAQLARVHKKIKRQNLWFILSNLLAAVIAVVAGVFALFAVRQEPSSLRISWAAGVFVLVIVTVSYRLRMQRRTWRAEAQSTRGFVELWQRRVRAKLRMILVGMYLLCLWLVFCGVLFAANWSRFGPDIHAHPRDWQVTTGALVLLIAGSFWFLAWHRRRKIAELDEVEGLLRELND